MSKDNEVFCFGSNRSGIHGLGAAKTAVQEHGAKYGTGEGHVGNSYAIPTKGFAVPDRNRPGKVYLPILSLEEIGKHISTFIQYANQHPELVFNVTKVGCGLAGFSETQIAPFFQGAPKNCNLPDGWRAINGEQTS